MRIAVISVVQAEFKHSEYHVVIPSTLPGADIEQWLLAHEDDWQTLDNEIDSSVQYIGGPVDESGWQLEEVRHRHKGGSIGDHKR